jgi:toxin ParE1/3/4
LTPPVIILHEAELEFQEIVEYYESKSSGLGIDFADEMRETIQIIQQSPERQPLQQDKTRRLLTHRFPYQIIYTVFKNEIWVIAFANQRRKPGYWKKRFK